VKQQRVAVVGSGYVGTVVAGCLARIGHDVVAVEADRQKLSRLARGTVPFFEAGADTLVREALDKGRLRFTADMADGVLSSDVIFLCVGTPESPDGHTDVRALAGAARSIAAVMDQPKVLVTKSTVPIGSGHWLETTIEDAMPPSMRDRAQFSVVSNPEFLRQGSAIHDFLHPDRVVIGSDDPAALERVVDLHAPILDQTFDDGDTNSRPTLVRTSLATAETVKYASNAFLALKVSFANEIANISELVGADGPDVAHALGLDERIGPRFLNAGVGWGGSCFGKDLGELIAAANDHGYDARLLRAARDVNRAQRELVVKKVRRGLRGLRGRRIGIFGLAFKPGTDDLRDAPAVDIARALLAGGAQVAAHDPVVREIPDLPAVRVVEDVYAVARQADAVIFLTDWAEYSELELDSLVVAMRGRLLVDGRNIFDPMKVESAGLRYEGIGRSAPAPYRAG
jgi:nucleotide sugar dehydrogenase